MSFTREPIAIFTGVSIIHQQSVHWKHCSNWESEQVQVPGLELQLVQWWDPHLQVWVCGFPLHVAQLEPAFKSNDVKVKVTIKVVDLNFNLLVGSVSPFLADVKILYLNNNLFMGTILQVNFSCLLISCLFVYFPLDPFHFFQMFILVSLIFCSITTFLASLTLPWSILQIVEIVVCKTHLILPIIETMSCITCLILHILEADLMNIYVQLILHIIEANLMSICSIDLAHHWSKFDEHMFIWSCTSLI